MKMELIEGSETSAISFVTPGNYPKENILHDFIICMELCMVRYGIVFIENNWEN